MSYGTGTRTVADVGRNVKRSFGDESGTELEDNDIINWVNDAMDEISDRNRMLKATSNSNSVVGQQDYTFPSANILQVEALHYAGKRLPNMSFAEAEEQIIGNTSIASQGEPIVWYEWGGKFSFYPVPPSIQTITLYLTLKPTHVTATTDTLPLEDKYFNDIVTYVISRAYEMDEEWQGAQLKSQQFDASLSIKADEERTAQNMTYPSITILDFY